MTRSFENIKNIKLIISRLLLGSKRSYLVRLQQTCFLLERQVDKFGNISLVNYLQNGGSILLVKYFKKLDHRSFLDDG